MTKRQEERLGIFFCDDRYEYDDNKGLFGLWCKYHKEDDWEKAAELARQIAELPERRIKHNVNSSIAF